MADDVGAALDARCRAVLGAILRYKDEAVDPHVPADVAAELRRVVLREVNGLSEFALSILDTVRDSGVMLNQLWLDDIDRKLDEVHAAVVVGSNGAGPV